ncbi:hypothetical protein GCM10007103_33970 [Salinimicrobium marinum]|uniref:Uncharacterized protein n=1 Tax=Salinimicrobium marinum TaxID=680283 RepID=A0A918W2S9_9FLAO|nr:hypothetical protein GCM10007103_33970 [Salinimicrobium marinum]
MLYLRNHHNDDKLHLLPIDHLEQHYIDPKIPASTKFINRFYWRVTGISLNKEKHVGKYRKHIQKIDPEQYDHIFIRSSGLEHETILAAAGLPILKKAVINFHDAFPVFWDTGSKLVLDNLTLQGLKKMWKVVITAKKCMSPSKMLSEDLQHLFGTNKAFYTLPHQFESSAFDIKSAIGVRAKKKQVTISYHGALQFARNINFLLDAYLELINENPLYKEKTEFVLRVKGAHSTGVINKYQDSPNLIFLGGLNFESSAFEQANETDILIILENCAPHSNILVGKAPFLSFLKKPILSLSPGRSEVRRIVGTGDFVASCNDQHEIKLKLSFLIDRILGGETEAEPFSDYFSDENFKKSILNILKD